MSSALAGSISAATYLFPMGLATATGSLVSVLICVAAFAVIQRKGYSS